MAKRLIWRAYEYKAQIGPGNSLVYRPLVEVEVFSKTSRKRRPILALIDSGTDSSVLHADIARGLEINLAKCQRVRLGGIGSLDGYLSNIQLVVPDIEIAIDIPVIFAEGLPFDGLLGQRHFFQRVRVRFEKDRNKFFLAPAP